MLIRCAICWNFQDNCLLNNKNIKLFHSISTMMKLKHFIPETLKENVQ